MTSIEIHQYELADIIDDVIPDLSTEKAYELHRAYRDVSRDLDHVNEQEKKKHDFLRLVVDGLLFGD